MAGQRPRLLLQLMLAGRLVAAIALAFAPIFCANLILSDRLAQAPDPTAAFGANLLGALTGGALEYLALVTGYQALLLVVATLYLGACVAMRFAGRWPGAQATRAPGETVTVQSWSDAARDNTGGGPAQHGRGPGTPCA
ncbi:hypothetical protein [Streptomyces viridochromogenes]|nr:hypothetical protein [Streptomyces viridochromogenes]